MPKVMGAYIRKILDSEPSLPSSVNETSHQPSLPTPIICAQSAPISSGTATNQSGHGIQKVTTNTKTTSKTSFKIKKINDGDWSLTFSNEQKKFLLFLLNIKPEKGDPIEKNTAMWWIKHFGIDKIKIALQVYWQQVDKAKTNPIIPTPDSIGAYVRKALNDGTQPCLASNLRNKAFAENFKKLNHWHDLTITEKYCRVEGYGKSGITTFQKPSSKKALKIAIVFILRPRFLRPCK